MKQGTKQRIVGSVVLLSLALIFLPIIFDGNGSYQAPVSSRIPDAPAVPVMPEPRVTRPEIIADSDAILVEEPAAAAVDDNANDNAETASADDVESTRAENAPDTGVNVVESEPDFISAAPLDETGLPRGWSVRLGAFSDSDNASALVTRLLEAGYKAYSRLRESSQGQLTLVYVGPWLDRGQADDYLARLQEEFQLAGMVERYEIEQL